MHFVNFTISVQLTVKCVGKVQKATPQRFHPFAILSFYMIQSLSCRSEAAAGGLSDTNHTRTQIKTERKLLEQREEKTGALNEAVGIDLPRRLD